MIKEKKAIKKNKSLGEKFKTLISDRIDEINLTLNNPYENRGILEDYRERLDFLEKFYDAMFW